MVSKVEKGLNYSSAGIVLIMTIITGLYYERPLSVVCGLTYFFAVCFCAYKKPFVLEEGDLIDKTIGCLHAFTLLRILGILGLLSLQNLGLIELYNIGESIHILKFTINKYSVYTAFLLWLIYNNEIAKTALENSQYRKKDLLIFFLSIITTEVHSVLFCYGLPKKYMFIVCVATAFSSVYKLSPTIVRRILVGFLTVFWGLVLGIYAEDLTIGTSIPRAVEAIVNISRTPPALLIIVSYFLLLLFLITAHHFIIGRKNHETFFLTLVVILIFNVGLYFLSVLSVLSPPIKAPFLNENTFCFEFVLYGLLFAVVNSNSRKETADFEDLQNVLLLETKM